MMNLVDSKNSFHLSKNLSTGVWISSLNRVKLVKIKGKFIHTMGYCSSSQIDSHLKDDYLYPEEALYLIENSNLIVYFDTNEAENNEKIPLSIQQCYELFFTNNSEIHLNDYKVYSSLVKYGYILRRFTTDIESEISIKDKQSQVNYNEESKPIINHSEHGQLTKMEILKRLNNLIPNLNESNLKSQKKEKKFKHFYQVYMPNKSFRKSEPGKPIFKLFTRIQNDQNLILPQLDELQSDYDTQIPILIAFVNNSNDVLFYSFDFNLNLPFLD